MRELPKSLLHEHLDGSLRPATLLDLCRKRSIAIPADNAADVARWMHENADAGSLERYLQGFAITIAAMATREGCERVAFEAAEDAARDGCVLAEFRIAPLLFEPHGLAPEPAMEGLLAGLARSGLACGLIVCGMRTENPEDSIRAARLAIRYKEHGVVGFDLAGAEKYFPPRDHAAAMAMAGEAGLGLTCHAGESDRGERVLEAADIGAVRIGHGIHIEMGDTPAQTRAWVEAARERGLHFEVCPSSNIHTGNARSIAEHPIRAMVADGLSVSCNTDNRLMSDITLTHELEALHREAGFTHAQLGELMRAGARASFLPKGKRDAAVREIERGWRLS